MGHQMETIPFDEWLKTELSERGWDQAELAQRSGISTTQISRLMNKARSPGPEACLGIARAFRVPAEDVFRRAGLLPQLVAGNEQSQAIRDLGEMLRYLPPEDVEVIVALVRALYERRRP